MTDADLIIIPGLRTKARPGDRVNWHRDGLRVPYCAEILRIKRYTQRPILLRLISREDRPVAPTKIWVGPHHISAVFHAKPGAARA